MDTDGMKSLVETVKDVLRIEATLDEVVIFLTEAQAPLQLEEGTWLKGTEPYKIRIDHPTHGAGQKHAHVYGRKGNQIGVINLDGTGSHGTKMYLPVSVADALMAKGFTIPPDRLVEWDIDTSASYQLLFG